MSNRWPGGLIRKTPVTPAGPYQNGAAPGMWTLADAAYWTKQGKWPTAGVTPNWIGLLSSPSNDWGEGVTSDANGNMYVCGYSQNSGRADLQVAKYDASGVIQWQRRLGSSSNNTYCRSVAVDSSGNVYACGYTYNAGYYQDWIIVKYNSSGNIQWQKYLQSDGADYAYGISVDTAGNVYVCGESAYRSGKDNIQLAKYNTSGTLQWQRDLYDSVGGWGQSVAVDAASNVYICGGSSAGTGYVHFEMAKYNSSGTLQWVRRLGTTASCQPYGIAVDSGGNSYVCGYSAASGTNDIQIAKYDTSGNIQWQRTLGGTNDDRGQSVTVDTSGNVYVLGYSDNGSVSYFQIAKYDSSGTIQWQRSLSSGGFDFGSAIAAFGNSIYVCGGIYSGSSSEILIGKLPNDGSMTGTYAVGGYSITYAASTLTDAASSLTSAVSVLQSGTPALTAGNSTLTDAASTLTSTVKTL